MFIDIYLCEEIYREESPLKLDARASRTVKFVQPVQDSSVPFPYSPLILICFISELYFSILKIGTKMKKKTMARASPDIIVKMPLVADLYECYLAKYRGVRYSTREMLLKKAFARFHKVFFLSAWND